MSDTYRGWLIEENWLHQWEGTGPNFEKWTDGGGWEDNGEAVTAPTREALIEEIDEYILEHE